MIDPLSGNHVQFPVSNRSTAHNSERNANLPSRWPFGWSPFPCRARNRKFFNDTRCCDARHKREKIVETDKANNVRGDNSPSFLPCWFPRRVKLEIDVLKKKKRKLAAEISLLPRGGKPLDGGAHCSIAYFRLRPAPCVCVRGVRRAHKLRPTICIVTHLPRGYVPRLFAPRLRFLRNTGGKKKRRFFLPSSLSRCPRASIRCKLYGRSFCID